MKIALVYDAVFPYVKGGGERRYYEIARRLSARHDVHIVSWQYWPGASRTLIDGVTYRGVGAPPPLYGRDGRRRMSEAASFAARVLPLLLRERFDVIDCPSVPFLPIFSARLASRVRRAAFVATWFEYWDAYWLQYLGSVAGRAARLTERLSARMGDAHIAISATTAVRMSHHRPASTPLTIIEPGVDIERINAAPQPEKSYDIVCTGRLNAQKNVPLLLRALAELSRAGSTRSCAIIGDGPDRAQLEALSHELGLVDSVRFIGRIEDDDEFYSAIKSARVFAWPSVAEGFGIGALEGMACGLPVVVAASEFSATEALVRDGETGAVVAAEPAAFAAAIASLLADPSRLTTMGAAAHARAQQSSWDRVAEAVERVYIEVADRRGN